MLRGVPIESFRRDRLRNAVVLLLLVLITVKTAAVILRGPVPLERDAMGYWHLSTLVMEGDVLMLSEPIAYRTPIYPWFLAILRTVAGPNSLWIISLVQGFLLVAAVAIAARLASRITRLPLAALCTLIAALPGVSALTYCTAILSETLFVFLLMLNLAAVLHYAESGGMARAIWAGISFALALLTRPIVLMLWVPHLVLIAWMAWRRRRAAKPLSRMGHRRFPIHRISHLLAAGATVMLLCMPWLGRNQYLFGEPFLTEFLGRNIWIVAFQDGSGTGLSLPQGDAADRLRLRLERVDAEQQWQGTWGVSNALVRSGLQDPDADRLMQQVAFDAIGTDPASFVGKAFRRCVNFWRCAATDLPRQGFDSGPYYNQTYWKRPVPLVEWAIEHRWSRSVAGNTLLMFLLFGSLAVLLIRPVTRPQGVWLALILGYFSVLTGVLEIPAYRYRMVVEPMVAMVIGSAFAVLLSRRRLEAKLVDSD